MNNQASFVARIIYVQSHSSGTAMVVALVGDGECSFTVQGTPPQVGDIYKISSEDPPQLIEKIGEAHSGAWNNDGDPMRWRKADKNGRTRMEILRQRHMIRRSVRDTMDGEGFIEIDVPLLVHGTTPDANIQSFAVGDRYLITSSELQLRRLEVGGFEKIYSLTQNYRRDDGEGPTRNQEFTMLEWVRVGDDMAAIERDTENVVLKAHKALGGKGRIIYKNQMIDLTLPWDRITVMDAIKKYTGASLPDYSLASIRQAAVDAGLHIHEEWKDDIFFLFSLLFSHIQPKLGWEKPLFIHDWPAFETSSALEKKGNLAVRSELFIGGIEICNGFPSFTNYDRQKETFEFQQQRRRNSGIPTVGLDDAYMTAMRLGLPPDIGMALGFDRLVMVLTESDDIRSTLAFAWDEV